MFTISDTRLALAKRRVGGGAELITQMQVLRDRLVERGHSPVAVEDIIQGLQSAQHLFERDSERFQQLLEQSDVAADKGEAPTSKPRKEPEA